MGYRVSAITHSELVLCTTAITTDNNSIRPLLRNIRRINILRMSLFRVAFTPTFKYTKKNKNLYPPPTIPQRNTRVVAYRTVRIPKKGFFIYLFYFLYEIV